MPSIPDTAETGVAGVGAVTDSSSAHDQTKGGVFIVAMGVSGTGKTTLGSAFAKRLGLPYVEGDDLHPKANVEKMSAGHPLTDTDREPWLALIRATAERTIKEQRGSDAPGALNGIVISCSALKRYYRDILRGLRNIGDDTKKVDAVELPAHEPGSIPPAAFDTYFLFINGDRETLVERMERRPGHFMKAKMLDSQLQTLEDPTGEKDVVPVSLLDSTETQVANGVEGLKKIAVSRDFKEYLEKL